MPSPLNKTRRKSITFKLRHKRTRNNNEKNNRMNNKTYHSINMNNNSINMRKSIKVNKTDKDFMRKNMNKYNSYMNILKHRNSILQTNKTRKNLNTFRIKYDNFKMHHMNVE